ncbi:MAG TPA: flippase, partial [Patescibacteria group bacterium]|nr:flippase [Patescibacteria group bacterium]
VLITTLAFLFISLNQIFVGLFQNRLRMDRVSIAEVIGRSVLVIGVFLVSYNNWGLLGAMVATVIANGFSFFFHYWFARRFFRVRIGMDWNWWKDILKKTWPLALTIVFNLIYLRADVLVLSLVKPQSDVGIYGATYKVIDVLTMIPFVFGGIILPILTSSWVKKNYEYFNNIIQRAVNFMLILCVPLVVGAQFLSRQVMTLIAGEDFAASGAVLKILVLACAFIFVGVMFSHVIIAIEKQKQIIWAYIFTSITSLIGYIIFIPQYSYVGAAWMTVYSEVVIGVFAFYYTWKYTRFLPRAATFWKTLLASGVMGGALYLIPTSFYDSLFGLFLTLVGSGVVYFLSLYAFRGITAQEIRILLNKN